MTDPQPVLPLAQSQLTPQPTPQPTTSRPLWPWLLGGGLLLAFLAVGVAVLVFGLSALGANMAAAGGGADAARTVKALDAAYENADCDAFEKLVAPKLRDALVDGEYDCDSWLEIADSFVLSGVYTYEVIVTESQGNRDGATVETTESWQSEEGAIDEVDFVYTLERTRNGWLIIGYDEK